MIDLAKGGILVTGGAGLIGSALVWELNRRGLDNILISDYLGTDDKWKNLTPLRFEDYIEADELQQRLRTNPSSLNHIRTIFHLGACSSTTETDAAYLVRNNFEYTKELAHHAVAQRIRFLYASSAATYGALTESVAESVNLHSLRPLNMYGYSKHLFDLHAQKTGMLPRITGLKYFNIFGPNEDHKGDMRSVVNKAYRQIQETGRMSLFKSYRPEYAHGEQLRDFLYVKDAVDATVSLAQDVDGGGIFNIGSGTPRTWRALAASIFAALQLEPQIDFIDMPEALRPKYQYFTCANTAKLRSFGYAQKPQSLEAAVADYVTAYLLPGKRLGD